MLFSLIVVCCVKQFLPTRPWSCNSSLDLSWGRKNLLHHWRFAWAAPGNHSCQIAPQKRAKRSCNDNNARIAADTCSGSSLQGAWISCSLQQVWLGATILERGCLLSNFRSGPPWPYLGSPLRITLKFCSFSQTRSDNCGPWVGRGRIPVRLRVLHFLHIWNEVLRPRSHRTRKLACN